MNDCACRTRRAIMLRAITSYLVDTSIPEHSHISNASLSGWIDDNYYVEFRILSRAEKEKESVPKPGVNIRYSDKDEPEYMQQHELDRRSRE